MIISERMLRCWWKAGAAEMLLQKDVTAESLLLALSGLLLSDARNGGR